MNKFIIPIIIGILAISGVAAADVYTPMGIDDMLSISVNNDTNADNQTNPSDNDNIGVQGNDIKAIGDGDNMEDIVKDPKKAIEYMEKTGNDEVMVNGEPVAIVKKGENSQEKPVEGPG